MLWKTPCAIPGIEAIDGRARSRNVDDDVWVTENGLVKHRHGTSAAPLVVPITRAHARNPRRANTGTPEAMGDDTSRVIGWCAYRDLMQKVLGREIYSRNILIFASGASQTTISNISRYKTYLNTFPTG
tara:strand:- start:88 stop:474 length:387 start_codon:yes stop_codon:yes gene_type:complete